MLKRLIIRSSSAERRLQKKGFFRPKQINSVYFSIASKSDKSFERPLIKLLHGLHWWDWSPMVSSGFRWFPMVSDGFRRFLKLSDGNI